MAASRPGNTACLFLVIDLSNYRLSKRQVKKIIEYRLSDDKIKLSNYRLSDIKKIIGCPPLVTSKYRAAKWHQVGITAFTLRLIAHLDKMLNKEGPIIKFNILFNPASPEQMEEISDASRGPAWPGVKILEGHAPPFSPGHHKEGGDAQTIQCCAQTCALSHPKISRHNLS
jgi:hypothetical protein